MSVMDMNSRMAMAEKLSVQQLQQAVQSGSLPAYIGIPLIEQKTKERAQMAAAQQGQQKPPSVAASILQQADEQEQQERGIDELPSNLPMMEDEEMGMAGGGIIAFADRGLVENQMLRDSYNPPRPSRGRYDMLGPVGNFRQLFRENAASEPNLEDPLSAISGLTQESLAADEARIEALPAQEQAAEKARVAKMLRQMEVERQQIIKQRQTEATARLGFLKQSAPEAAAKFEQENQSVLNPQAAQPQTRQADANLDNQMLIDSNNGVAALPSAKLVPTGTPGAPRTAPQGGSPNAFSPTPQMTSAAQPESAMDRYARMLEAQGEDSAKSRKDAKAMAIIQAGLGMMGGTSPNAFANIAAGAMPAIQGYQQALQGLRKDDRERIGKLMEMGISKEKLGLELKKLGIEDKKADAMVNLYNARAGAAGSGAGAGKEARLYAFKAGQDLNRVETDVARLRNSEEYKKAKGVLAMPFDPKKSSPALVNMRTEAQATIDAIEAEAKRRLNTAKDAVTFYNREAGIDKGDKSGKEDVDLNQFFKKP